MLSPLGGFGKFLCVILALSIPSSVAPTMYTFSSSFMTIGTYFALVPRYLYIFVAEAMYVSACLTTDSLADRCYVYSLIPVAVIGATSFYETFVDVLSKSAWTYSLFTLTTASCCVGIIGYWSCVWALIILTEHFVFRRNTWARYDMEVWDSARGLPWGAAAVVSFACAFGIIIPSMNQAWYVGPIAKTGTGDIGILVGSALAFVLYLVLRSAEIAYTGR